MYGVGGPLENHHHPAATAATAGERAYCRLVGALEMKARHQFMDVCDVKVTNEDGFLTDIESGSIVWPAKLCFCLYMWTLALCCTKSVSLRQVLPARCH